MWRWSPPILSLRWRCPDRQTGLPYSLAPIDFCTNLLAAGKDSSLTSLIHSQGVVEKLLQLHRIIAEYPFHTTVEFPIQAIA